MVLTGIVGIPVGGTTNCPSYAKLSKVRQNFALNFLPKWVYNPVAMHRIVESNHDLIPSMIP
jgi:hypothetical protein